MAARETSGGLSSEPKRPKKSKASATVQSLMTIAPATRATARRTPGRSRDLTKRLPVNSTPFSLTDQGLSIIVLEQTASHVKTIGFAWLRACSLHVAAIAIDLIIMAALRSRPHGER